MRITLVVPGGVDPSGRDKVIPAVLALIARVGADHDVAVVALGHDRVAGRWAIPGAEVINVPAESPGLAGLTRIVSRGVRAVGEFGRPEVVVGLWASVSGLVAGLAARRHGAGCHVHVAGGELAALPEIGYGGALGRGGRMIAWSALRLAHRVSVPTEWLGEQVRAAGRVPDAVIPLGIDPARFSPPAVVRSSNRVAEGGGRLLQIASINRVKDQTTLLRAFALARRARPDLALTIAGVDTLGGAMADLARDLGLADAVEFAGFVAPDDVPALVARADLHVVSSRHEAGPVAYLEASAGGLATVGTAVGHLADNARLQPPAAVAVPPGDAAALSRAILEVLGDETRRASLAAAAGEFARTHDADATARAFVAEWTTLVQARTSRSSAAGTAAGSSPRAST